MEGGPRGAADSRSPWTGTRRTDARSIQSALSGEGPTASSGAERVLAWETTRHWEHRVSSCGAEECAAPSADRSSTAASPACATCAPATASRPCSTGTASCTTRASRPTAAERRRRKRGPGMRGKTFMMVEGADKSSEAERGQVSACSADAPPGSPQALAAAEPVRGASALAAANKKTVPGNPARPAEGHPVTPPSRFSPGSGAGPRPSPAPPRRSRPEAGAAPSGWPA